MSSTASISTKNLPFNETFDSKQSEIEHIVRYQKAIPYVKGLRVLDVGCAARSGPAQCAITAKDVVGIDIIPTQVEWAQRTYGSKNLNFYVGDVTSLTFEANSFDVILCLDVIEHVSDPLAAIKEMRRVLTPGGRLILTTPNAVRQKGVNHKKLSGNEFHETEFEASDLRKMLQACDFNIEEFEGFKWSVEVDGKAEFIRSIIRNTIPVYVRRCLNFQVRESIGNLIRLACGGLPARSINQQHYLTIKDPHKSDYFWVVSRAT